MVQFAHLTSGTACGNGTASTDRTYSTVRTDITAGKAATIGTIITVVELDIWLAQLAQHKVSKLLATCVIFFTELAYGFSTEIVGLKFKSRLD